MVYHLLNYCFNISKSPILSSTVSVSSIVRKTVPEVRPIETSPQTVARFLISSAGRPVSFAALSTAFSMARFRFCPLPTFVPFYFATNRFSSLGRSCMKRVNP